jgi:hypothetical protein
MNQLALQSVQRVEILNYEHAPSGSPRRAKNSNWLVSTSYYSSNRLRAPPISTKHRRRRRQKRPVLDQCRAKNKLLLLFSRANACTYTHTRMRLYSRRTVCEHVTQFASCQNSRPLNISLSMHRQRERFVVHAARPYYQPTGKNKQ